MDQNSFKQLIFNCSGKDFNDLARHIFYYQAKYNAVYAKFLQLIDIRPQQIEKIEDIPYLPIEFFKTHMVSCSDIDEDCFCFTSSSTTGTGLSKHFIPNIELYHKAFIQSFQYQYGKIKDFTFRFLLPSYLEREGSSLVYMATEMLKISKKGGFYIHNFDKLQMDLMADKKSKRKTIMLGVSYALLDFSENYSMDLSDIIVMETGGMKGQRKEMVREELHGILKHNLNCSQIASEYGMTELLSQAYSKENGLFNCPPWMRISVAQTTDPLKNEGIGKSGLIQVMDLSNIDSCCFIGTSDLGKVYENGTFEVLGRFDHSEARGCNLMVS
jgi:hypothetical protein